MGGMQLATAASQAPPSSSASSFLALLRRLTELHATEQEVSQLPQLCISLKLVQQSQPADGHAEDSRKSAVCAGDADANSSDDGEADARLACVQLAAQLLFLGLSKPLHKQLLAALRPAFADAALLPALRAVLADHAPADPAAVRKSSDESPGAASAASMPAAAAWASLLAFPPAHELLEASACAALTSLAAKTQAALDGISAGRHLSPMLAVDLQVRCSHL